MSRSHCMVDIAVNAKLSSTGESVETPLRRALRRLFRRKSAVFGLAFVVFFVALAVFAPLLSPYDPTAQSWTLVRNEPSALHWFGTDDLGRDILARVIFGTRASLLAGVISVGIALSIGVPLGLAAGYLGGLLDALISRMAPGEEEALPIGKSCERFLVGLYPVNEDPQN